MYVEKMKAAIEKQIEGIDKREATYGFAQHLMSIVGNEERLAQIVCEDFENNRNIKDFAVEIKKAADEIEKEHRSKNKNGRDHTVNISFFYVDEKIREFFGLGSASEQQAAAPTKMSAPKADKPKVLSLADLL